MKIRKFFEQYELDVDGDGGIAEEYVKLIISTYIDKQHLEHVTLEKVYRDVVKGDDLDESQCEIIRDELKIYITFLLRYAKQIRKIFEIDAEDYNL